MIEFVLPGSVEPLTCRSSPIVLGQDPEIFFCQEYLVTIAHHGCHPGEGELGKGIGVFNRTLLLLLDRVVAIGSNIARPKPLHEEFNEGQADTDAVCDEIGQVRIVDLLGDKGSKLDGEGDQEQKPVEERNSARVSNARMLKPLNGEDDKERKDGQKSGEDSKVAVPDLR